MFKSIFLLTFAFALAVANESFFTSDGDLRCKYALHLILLNYKDCVMSHYIISKLFKTRLTRLTHKYVSSSLRIQILHQLPLHTLLIYRQIPSSLRIPLLHQLLFGNFFWFWFKQARFGCFCLNFWYPLSFRARLESKLARTLLVIQLKISII